MAQGTSSHKHPSLPLQEEMHTLGRASIPTPCIKPFKADLLTILYDLPRVVYVLYDLYGPDRVPGGDPCNLHDLAHVS